MALQANAEPDLQQTGKRLKPIIAGLVEGIMQLVVDPLTQAKVLHLPWCHIYIQRVLVSAFSVISSQVEGDMQFIVHP